MTKLRFVTKDFQLNRFNNHFVKIIGPVRSEYAVRTMGSHMAAVVCVAFPAGQKMDVFTDELFIVTDEDLRTELTNTILDNFLMGE